MINAISNIIVTFGGIVANTELINAFPDPDDRMTESAYEQAKYNGISYQMDFTRAPG